MHPINYQLLASTDLQLETGNIYSHLMMARFIRNISDQILVITDQEECNGARYRQRPLQTSDGLFIELHHTIVKRQKW
jgi:hypothetical protein